MGRCPSCGRWHTLVEEVVAGLGEKRAKAAVAPQLKRLDELDLGGRPRLATGSAELDRVLGGGLVPGSLVLLGGDPGIGKSTLVLQACQALAKAGQKVLYATGEESLEQVGLRARRLGGVQGDFQLLSDTAFESVEAAVGQVNPSLLVVDSIQTLASADLPASAGSVSQVRECAQRLMVMAKARGMAVFVVGHVTKDGALAGPRVLEHLVDVVLHMEGERHQGLRMLRTVKNRFGATQELGLFEMGEAGLGDMAEAGTRLLGPRRAGATGTVLTIAMEGSRPLLAEVQALVTVAHYGTPARQSTGLDPYRLSVLYAVLEKRCSLELYGHDVFVAVAGGLRLEEPSSDLALALAVASSLRGRALDPTLAALGEIGLGGELKPARGSEARLREAARSGVKRVLLPREEGKSMDKLAKLGVEAIFAATTEEAFEKAF